MSYWSDVVSPSSYRRKRTPIHLLSQERDKADEAITSGVIKQKSVSRELSPEEKRMMENS